ncbi:hypothetical protein MAR_038192 [Mya arenaria]|uniref:TIR domain-containing protein n=1 Tax=Mya arenaria TaxID=6604 RepID=A0ABY7FQM9_MYAAR|nr:hypothetical protein MAR_038192 [Mya arenaria]
MKSKYLKSILETRQVIRITGHFARCNSRTFVNWVLTSDDSDSEIVLEFLWPLLTDAFKTNVGDVEGEGLKFVGIGDRHFRPGYGIMDEVNKCFNDTAVILAAVSNAFCESVFCKNELEYAIILKKPVVLLFLEQIPEESMPACVRQLFNKNVRVKIEMKDDEIKVTPHVDDVCSAIFSLAY